MERDMYFNTEVTMLCCVWSIVKETGITSVIFVLKNMPIINCYVTRWQFNRGELLHSELAIWEIQTVTTST